MDCGPKNVDFKSLASFFETIFSALTNKQEQLIVNGREFTVPLAELGFHYGRICNKAGNSTEALAVFDKLLKIAGSENHCKNGHFKLQIPSQVCCCVCLVCKAAILLNSTIKSQTQESLQQMLFESNRLISQILKCSTLPSPMLKLLSDSLEYLRINLQNEEVRKNHPLFHWRLSQEQFKCCSLTSQSSLRSVSGLIPSCFKPNVMIWWHSWDTV